ncbi:MAG: DNA recombination protein RmuC [Alcaligenaceae bacterium]|nr:DNA recombination protein RmuC [Alcaligenaceae bacterium]
MQELNSIYMFAGLLLAAFGIGALLVSIVMQLTLNRLRTKAVLLESQLHDSDTQRDEQQFAYHVLQQDFKQLDNEKDALDKMLSGKETELHLIKEQLIQIMQIKQQLESGQQAALMKIADLDKENTLLQAQYQQKKDTLNELKVAFQQSRQLLSTEFENLANKIMDEKSQLFSVQNQQAMDGLLQPLKEKLDGFQARVNEVHDQSLKGHTLLHANIQQFMDIGMKMTQDADALARALKGDKKTLGNWGEMQLERALEMAGLVKGDHFQAQAHFRNEAGQSQLPDFVLYLPDGKHMIIDSKVSLNDYQQAVNATQDGLMQSSLDAHARAVRNHIDQLSEKNYSNLQGMHSPGFVLMFMPVEAAYIEALRHPSNLFQYGYEKGVVLVSHTTLMPVLRTVSYLWMMARSNEQAAQIGDRAVDIYNQVTRVAEHLSRLGGTLNTVGTHYNAVVGSLAGRQGLIGKVERFNELSAKASRKMVEPEPIHPDFDVSRLDALVKNGQPQ